MRAAFAWIRETYGIGAWKVWEQAPDARHPPVPAEYAAYRRAQTRYYKWMYRLNVPLLSGALLLATVGAITQSVVAAQVMSVPLVLLAASSIGHSLINAPQYFWRKWKAGYLPAAWGEIPRKRFRK